MIRRILLAGLVATAAGAGGCHHCRKHCRDTAPPPPGGALIPPPPGGLPSTLPPVPGPGTAPPAPAGPGTDLPPPTIPDTSRNFRPDPPRAGAGPQLLLPDPLPGMSSAAQKPGARSPGDLPPSGSDLPPRQLSPSRPAAPGTAPAGTVPGVSAFAVVKPGVANGRKPAVEGFDALKARGYRTAVYLHAPGEDVSAARDLAEKTGLTFVGIPVSPGTLKAGFERFRDVLGDPGARPVFVFDDDGVRAGSLWYLYFRTADVLGDDAARVRAAPLGLREDGDEQTKFWVAIQDYLARR